jgi:hypothetical protein
MKNVKQRNNETIEQGLHYGMDDVAIEKMNYKGRQFQTSRRREKANNMGYVRTLLQCTVLDFLHTNILILNY